MADSVYVDRFSPLDPGPNRVDDSRVNSVDRGVGLIAAGSAIVLASLLLRWWGTRKEPAESRSMQATQTTLLLGLGVFGILLGAIELVR